jgi:hypothetical protein
MKGLLVLIWLGILAVGGWLLLDYTRMSLLFPNSDFETATLQNWTAEGEAFSGQPTPVDTIEKRVRANVFARGRYLIGTFEGNQLRGRGDAPIGSLRSIPFIIRGERIRFLIGAGDGTSEVSVQLMVENRVVRQSIGYGKATNSESLVPVEWDVSPWRGREARIQINDSASNGWGHINVDDFRIR